MQSLKYLETDNILNAVLRLYERSVETVNEDVETVRNWMKNQPHLPEILDDNSIRNFLILNKFSIEKTKQKIDMYYSAKTVIPDLFENINPECSNIKELNKIAYWILLPKLTKDMYRASIFKMRNKDLIDKMQPHNVLALFLHFQEVRLKEDVMLGDITIFDMEGINFGYLTKLTPSFLMKALMLYEKIYSSALKGVYVVNSPPFVSTIMAILKSIMKPKLFARIHLCEDTSILMETFPKEILPKDYGGEEKSVEELHELHALKLNQYQYRYDELDKLKVDESLRPNKLQNHEILGFYGNFKKLNVD